MDNELKTMLQSVLNESLTPIKEELQNLNQRVGGIEQRVGSIESDLKTIKSDVAEIKTDNPLIKQAVLETSESVKRIESTREQHEHTLDLLARRSIDQEAELKRIK